MKGTVKISLEDYERLKDVEKSFANKSSAVATERQEILRKLDFSRVTLTVWTRFLLDKFEVDTPLSELIDEFNQKGTAAMLEVKSHEGREYIVAKEKSNNYIT